MALVSCIMPTRDRRPFVEQSIWYFLRQDYASRELIIVDDGQSPIEDLVPHDGRIRYFRLKQPLSIGAKRNLACEVSRGELIAHWDDDDWIGPHGCPTWFPRRKASRGRVIGAFGFLCPHKGFWRLLDVLRELPGTELLLFSYAKSREVEVSWEEAAAGLPVRRIAEYLPAHEIARCLAAEADVLGFWYDEVPHDSASGAIRIGLATGVPVLASPTHWFDDLREATYQPANLRDGIARLLEDTELRKDLTDQARCYCEAHSWPRVAEQHLSFWRNIAESN